MFFKMNNKTLLLQSYLKYSIKVNRPVAMSVLVFFRFKYSSCVYKFKCLSVK